MTMTSIHSTLHVDIMYEPLCDIGALNHEVRLKLNCLIVCWWHCYKAMWRTVAADIVP